MAFIVNMYGGGGWRRVGNASSTSSTPRNIAATLAKENF